jgi:uncharacterized protein (DUF58 family)
MFEPTERAVWILVAIGAVGLVGAALPTLGDLALVASLGLVLGLVADFFLAGSPARIAVRRKFDGRAVQGTPHAIGRELVAARAGSVEITDTLPAAASPDGRGADETLALRLNAGERATVTSDAIFHARGSHRFGRVTVRTLGPLGLLRRRKRVKLPDEVRVMPDLVRIGALAERLLRGQDAAGKRKRARSEGREFESLREYVRGDDVRQIEWKATARRGYLVVKRMQPETRQDIVMLVDTGRQLAGRHADVDGGQPRLDVVVRAALTMSAAALSRGDRVGMIPFAGDVRGFASPQPGTGHLRRLADVVGELEPVPEEADYGEAVRFLLRRQKKRAMVCFFTDVTDEPSARALAGAIARLRGRHLPVVVAVGDPGLARVERGEVEADPGDLVAPLMPAAASRLLLHRRKALAALSAAGAKVIDAPGPVAAASAVREYATVKATGKL